VVEKGPTDHKRRKYGEEPFYPDHILRQAVQLTLLLAFLVFLASFFPPPHLPEADPYTVPQTIRTQWYLLPAKQFLLLLDKSGFLGSWAPKVIGVLFQGAGALFLLFLPFLDKNPSSDPRKRPYALRIGISILMFTTLLTFWGFLS